MGIRAALGARRGDLVWLVLRQGFTLSAVGLGLGLLGTIAAARLLRTFLFGVGTADPIATAAAATILLAIAALACYLPAHRASRVDPMRALRYE